VFNDQQELCMSSPEQAAQKMIDNLPGKTGKSLEQWLALLSKQNFEKHGEIIKWLKSEHAVTHGFANLIAHMHRNAASGESTNPTDLVTAQYAGAKAALRPIYEAIVGVVSGFGKDVEISPKKTYVSLRRTKQFALVQPSTKDRVDVGINLKGEPTTTRLEASGSFNTMVTHRVRLSGPEDVDADLQRWLKKAYDAS
jgi:predicted transport protein